jgi:hypothetical protein
METTNKHKEWADAISEADKMMEAIAGTHNIDEYLGNLRQNGFLASEDETKQQAAPTATDALTGDVWEQLRAKGMTGQQLADIIEEAERATQDGEHCIEYLRAKGYAFDAGDWVGWVFRSRKRDGRDNIIDYLDAKIKGTDTLTPVVDTIAPGITSEPMEAVYFDRDALVEPKEKLYQLNAKGTRYYYRLGDDGRAVFYPSVTTIIAKTLIQSPWLIEWKASKGIEEAERYALERASYGTFMHAEIEQLIISRRCDLDQLDERLQRYVEEKHLKSDFVFYADDLRKDLLAFAQFAIDYDVRPLAVEVALLSVEKGYAGMIDLPCTMRAKAGTDEKGRIAAIVDFKSGRKGFHEEHEIQLGMYRDLWNENFPDRPIERIFNWSPKDWRKRPSYNLKEQTEARSLAKIPALLRLAEVDGIAAGGELTTVGGIIDLDDEGGLEANVSTATLEEVVAGRHTKK